jgi:ABC-2 type transport system permease protein
VTERRARLERIYGLVLKEVRQILRDRRIVLVIFLAPVVQLVVFGYAVSTDVWKVDTFVVDRDHTAASRELADVLTASGYFEITGRSRDPGEMVRALDGGEALVGLEIPRGFASDLVSRGGAQVQLLIDGTNSNSASVAQSYAERIILQHGLRSAPGLMSEALPAVMIDLRERAWYNPNLDSRDYNVPAVVGALVLLVCLLLTSLAVVREREIGTLEQLRVSPLTPGELIAGKMLPFAMIGLIDLVIVIAVALGWFGVPFRGSFLLLAFASGLYLLSGLGLGLLISTVSSTQQEAFMASFLVFMPTILLSGFMFPVASMPEVFQWLTLLNPVRHYVEVVRAIFLKGSSPGIVWPQLLALLGLGVGLLWLAAWRFRRAA